MEFLSFSHVRGPYVRSLLAKRAIADLTIFGVLAASLIVIYVLIPVKPL